MLLTFGEATFRELVIQPGLRVRGGGGWMPRTARAGGNASPEPGRRGMIDGVALILDSDGRWIPRRANLGQSPIVWLASRKDENGQAWLSPAEVAAAGRLGLDAEAALRGPSLRCAGTPCPAPAADRRHGPSPEIRPWPRAARSRRR